MVGDLSGPQWRCEGAGDDELTGLPGRWEALGARAEAGKLGVVRELIRRRARPGIGGYLRMHGDLPGQWDDGMAHEVSQALGISIRAAGHLISLAWDLQARLPGTGAALAAGLLSPWKARLVSDEVAVLTGELAAQAEKLIVDQVTPLTTPGELGKLAALAVCTADPDGAAKRREYAGREKARVAFWRANGGACAMAAYGLPTDAALAASDAVETRARGYKTARTRPDATLDQLRVLAFLDLLNGITLGARLASDRAAQDQAAPGPGHGGTGERTAGQPSPAGGPGDPDAGGTGRGGGDGDGDSQDGAAAGSAWHRGNGGGHPDQNPATTGAAGGAAPAASPPALAARVNLTIPLATLLGLAGRPGAAHGLGPLDPALARDLTAAAANSPHSQWCTTITGAQGVAIGHGCATLARKAKRSRANPPPASRAGPGPRWGFTPRGQPGPPGGYGTWTLTLPGGRQLTVKLGPVPVSDCDHRHQTGSYQPGDALRHLVQVRDGTCTFPTCSRHARDTDFEHTTPHHKGGRTCACNGAARSRRCHRVKQSHGWTVTQPEPGRHQWTTPSGRTYTKGPMRYPA